MESVLIYVTWYYISLINLLTQKYLLYRRMFDHPLSFSFIKSEIFMFLTDLEKGFESKEERRTGGQSAWRKWAFKRGTIGPSSRVNSCVANLFLHSRDFLSAATAVFSFKEINHYCPTSFFFFWANCPTSLIRSLPQEEDKFIVLGPYFSYHKLFLYVCIL